MSAGGRITLDPREEDRALDQTGGRDVVGVTRRRRGSEDERGFVCAYELSEAGDSAFGP